MQNFDAYYAYEGTITFDSSFDLPIKERKMEQLVPRISQCVRHSMNTDYKLYIVREYHKLHKGNNAPDDPEAPHYHLIMYSKYRLAVSRVKGIYNMLREYYGRCQFHIMTTMRRAHWWEYINKDVNKNDELYGFQHAMWIDIGPIMTCKPRNRDYYYSDSDISDDEL